MYTDGAEPLHGRINEPKSIFIMTTSTSERSYSHLLSLNSSLYDVRFGKGYGSLDVLGHNANIGWTSCQFCKRQERQYRTLQKTRISIPRHARMALCITGVGTYVRWLYSPLRNCVMSSTNLYCGFFHIRAIHEIAAPYKWHWASKIMYITNTIAISDVQTWYNAITM